MNKFIFITILYLVVFISTTLSSSLSASELHDTIEFREIISQINNDGSIPVCNVNKHQSRNCKTINNQLVCQSISNCLAYFSNGNGEGLIINVPSGNYSDSDCPGSIYKAPNGGTINIVSQNGQSTFNCGANQFLNITFSIPTTFVINGLNLIGNNESDIGCLELNDISNQNESVIYFNNVYAVNWNSNSDINGAFLTAINFDSVYIHSSNISENTALASSVILAEGATVTFYQSYFGYNHVFSGGVTAYSVNVWNSIFENNFAYIAGGGIYATDSIFFVNSQFYNNRAGYGGVVYGNNASLYIYNSFFQNNTAGFGGAIYVDSENITIVNSQFYSHIAEVHIIGESASGGVIYLTSSNGNTVVLKLVNCTFDDNTGDLGGAIYLDAASLDATNSTFTHNTANFDGGAISWINVDLSPHYINLISCNLDNNFANNDGGALYLSQYYRQPVYLNLTGTTFDQNQAGQYAGSIFFVNVPNQFVGGVFTNSKSSESNSTTFYSESIEGENIVYFEYSLPQYTVPIFNESTFKYWKVFGAHGSCKSGVAVINENGVILSCKKFRNKLRFTPN